MKKPKAPKILDAIADVVLRYRPKAKSKPAKKRQREQLPRTYCESAAY
jgi:hypothetical protein